MLQIISDVHDDIEQGQDSDPILSVALFKNLLRSAKFHAKKIKKTKNIMYRPMIDELFEGSWEGNNCIKSKADARICIKICSRWSKRESEKNNRNITELAGNVGP